MPRHIACLTFDFDAYINVKAGFNPASLQGGNHGHFTSRRSRRRRCARGNGRKRQGDGAILRVQAEPALSGALARNSRSELPEIPHLQQHGGADRQRHALGGRARLFSRWRISVVERHSQQPDHEVRRKGRQRLGVPQPFEFRQRQHPRPAGTPRHLRALGDAAHHAHREGRQDHRARRQFRGQASQRAERHRGEVGRHGLVQRSAIRHPRRLGRVQGDT